MYNEVAARDIGVMVVRRPSIPSPVRRISEITIPGRDGSLIVGEGTYEDILISVDLNYMSPSNEWGAVFRKIKKWLLGKGSGRLFLSDDMAFFFKVKNVEIGENERTSKRIGVITPTFTCDPYIYLNAGTIPIEQTTPTILNLYSLSKPIYIVTGTGECKLWVNGNIMTANVEGNLTIDTDLMIAYKEDGTIQNTKVTGDYEGLYLKEGENDLTINNPFSLQIIPNWRTL